MVVAECPPAGTLVQDRPPAGIPPALSDLGFQAHFAAPPGAPSPPVHTEATSPQKPIAPSRQLDICLGRGRRDCRCSGHMVRRRARAIHASLVEELERVAGGVFGEVRRVGGGKVRDVLERVRKCPGATRRHDVCGELSHIAYSCRFPLCPWCQRRRAERERAALVLLIERLHGRLNPKMATFTVPNVDELGTAMPELSKAHTQLRRRRSWQDRVNGGVVSFEVTYTARKGWHPHAHAFIDADYIHRWPYWEIRRSERPGRVWDVVRKHAGLAREWTKVCNSTKKDGTPRYPMLSKPGLDVGHPGAVIPQECLERRRDGHSACLDNPDDWYYIDIRTADAGAVEEVIKYVVKGDSLVRQGFDVMNEYLDGVKGLRGVQTFGSLYDVRVDGATGEEKSDEEREPPTRKGECPWQDCPDPRKPEWKFVCYGILELGPEDDGLEVHLAYSNATGSSRLSRGPPVDQLELDPQEVAWK